MTPDVGGILKYIYYPTTSSMLAIVTTANAIAFFDLTTNTKIQTKKFPSNTPAILLPSSPYLLLMGSKIEALEFRENNIIKRIEVSAVAVSIKNNELYLAMQNKLAVLALDNFSLIRQKIFDNMKRIVRIDFNQNHKHLYLLGHSMVCR